LQSSSPQPSLRPKKYLKKVGQKEGQLHYSCPKEGNKIVLRQSYGKISYSETLFWQHPKIFKKI